MTSTSPDAEQAVSYFEVSLGRRDAIAKFVWTILSHHGTFEEALDAIASGDIGISIQQVTVKRSSDGAFERKSVSVDLPFYFAPDDDLYLSARGDVQAIGADTNAWAAKMAEMGSAYWAKESRR